MGMNKYEYQSLMSPGYVKIAIYHGISRILIRQPCIQDDPTLNCLFEHDDVSLVVTGSDNVWPILKHDKQ